MFTFTKNDLRQNSPKKHRLAGKSLFKAKKNLIFVIGFMTLVLLAGIWIHNINSIAYAVTVNGKQTLVYENKDQAEQAVKKFLETKSQEIGKTVTTDDKIEVKEIRIAKKDEVLSTGDDIKLLEEKLQMLVPGAALIINGEEKVILPDQKAAENLLEEIKVHYTPTGKGINVVKVELKEDVKIIEKNVPMDKVTDEESAFHLLTLGAEKMVTHTVEKGESFWSIAKANKMSVKDLEEANPEYNPDKIQIGDEIKLVKMDPIIHVTTVSEFTEVKKVPYSVVVENDNNMLRGKEKVKQAGKDGSKEFKYLLVEENGRQVDKQFVSGTVLNKPVDKVVVRGTKLVLASRGSGGSGDLRWPIRGRITSRFGSRSLGYHTGLDIDGSTGDPVRAAEAGTVTYVGRDGNYGKVVRINHGNGIQTWYAHLSAYEVKTGDKVSRGDLIGRVGSTGRSTGSHLHFEVRINGNAVNPLKYLD
ncbi:MAG: peptidoglycan DD-metalloendopeptidase family protein [Bacillota bacterium]|jgi:murein DD-endopeptidase MepM/ murein hydrolase activator NlpD